MPKIHVEMVPMPTGLSPAEAWAKFLEATGLPPNDSMQSVFLAGFSSGMAYLDGRMGNAAKQATGEIAGLVSGAADAADQAHRA